MGKTLRGTLVLAASLALCSCAAFDALGGESGGGGVNCPDGTIEDYDGECLVGNNSCALAIDILNEPSGMHSGDTSSHSDDITPGDYYCGGDEPLELGTGGNDAFYTLEAVAGQVINAALAAAGYDAVLYVMEGGCGLAQCVVGSDADPEFISYGVSRDGTYVIVVDGLSPSESGSYQLSVGLESPDACSEAGNFAAHYTCGTAMDITAAASAPGGARVYGNLSTATGSQIDPGSSCTGSMLGAGGGVEAYYKLTGVAADAYITANAGSETSDVIIYLLSADCSGVGGCVAGADDPETLEFSAAATGDYYVVVEGYDDANSGCFWLDVQITPPPKGNQPGGVAPIIKAQNEII